MKNKWMIYGANGYTGKLIAQTAVQRGLQPVLAGRSAEKIQPLADELNLEMRVFSLDQPDEVAAALAGIKIVLHCAGPFSVTSAPMIEGCLKAGAHYLDITGEINVMEHTHHPSQSRRAAEAGVVLCSGVGFDVIPTDCIAHKLKELLPDAVSLSLGFDTSSKISPGTMKTVIEGIGSGSLVRKEGRVTNIPLGKEQRDIDFGRGVRSATAIPWGDVSTAYHTTGINTIYTWVPMPRPIVTMVRILSLAAPVLSKSTVQTLLKNAVDRFVKGPDDEERKNHPAFVWGEARNAAGKKIAARIQTANVYTVTIEGALTSVIRLLDKYPAGGSYTPSVLFGSDLVEELPDSGRLQIE